MFCFQLSLSQNSMLTKVFGLLLPSPSAKLLLCGLLNTNTASLPAITHSQCLQPSCPSEASPAKSFKRVSLEFDNTCVSVRLSPDFFEFRNVVPACYRSTKSLLFVHIRQDQILSSLCESTFVSTLVFYLHCRRSAQQGCTAAAAAQSTITQSCK